MTPNTQVKTATETCPAKINLFLAITGRRSDGFHDLVSLVTPLAFGDRLSAFEVHPGSGETQIHCDDPALALDPTNLVWRATDAFRAATGWGAGVRFELEKRIPVGAGLGGGSSDAAAALRALNTLAGEPLAPAQLSAVASQVGSDCALFLAGGPAMMRGRGERVEPLANPSALSRLKGRRLLVFKPSFAIATAWAYARVAELGAYLAKAEAETALLSWLGDPSAPVEKVLKNTMEAAAFGKFPALPVLLSRIRNAWGLEPRMSGSGSACFVFLPDFGGPAPAEVAALIRDSWGASAFVLETVLL